MPPSKPQLNHAFLLFFNSPQCESHQQQPTNSYGLRTRCQEAVSSVPVMQSLCHQCFQAIDAFRPSMDSAHVAKKPFNQSPVMQSF